MQVRDALPDLQESQVGPTVREATSWSYFTRQPFHWEPAVLSFETTLKPVIQAQELTGTEAGRAGGEEAERAKQPV